MFASLIKCPVKALILAFILSVVVTGCSDTTIGTRSFTESQTFPIPGGIIPGVPAGLVVPAVPIPVPFNLTEQEGYSDGDFDFVTSVFVRGITLDISPTSTDPSVEVGISEEDGNLDTFEFVQSLNIALQANVNGEMRTAQIADLPMNDPQIASNATTLSLNTNGDEDIRDLIEAPGGSTIIVTISGTVPPDFVIVDASLLFRVGVGFR